MGIEDNSIWRGRREQRAALVIGATGGIGVVCCERLAAAGYRIGAADIDRDAANALIARIQGESHHAFEVDATDEAQIDRLFATAEKEMDGVAILLYVSGACFVDPGNPRSLVHITANIWDSAERLNSRGLFFAIRAFIRLRAARSLEGSRIITISSMAGVAPSGLHTGAAYAASKAAAINLTRFAALEGGPMGITANAIAPATILTQRALDDMTPEQLEIIASVTPMRRNGRPENVAAAVQYFADPDADFTSGCVLELNGGRHMG